MTRSLLTCFIVLFGLIKPLCQQQLDLAVDPTYQAILKTAKSDPEANPFVFNNELTNPLFFPADVQQQFGQGIYCLHFSRLKDNIVAVPDGTGRLYDFKSENQKLSVERLDHTTYVGYNFSNLVFTFRDTLYSLGGYGFWKYNGVLRYYDTNTKGWELAPTNIEVHISGDPHYSGEWLNAKEGSLYYVARSLRHDERKGYVGPSTPYQDTTSIYKLDLKSKNWTKLGQLSKKFVAYMNSAKKIAELPFGELAISGNIKDKRIILINYDQNRVELLKDTLSRQLYNRIYTGYASKFTWYSSGRLSLGPVLPDTLFQIPLNEKSFTHLPVTIYEPVKESKFNRSSSASIVLWLSGGLLVGLIIGRLSVNKFGKGQTQVSDVTIPVRNIFNPFEVNILNGFRNNNYALLPEEVNVILETDRKSVEVQKKYRSEAIRGINEKFSKLLNTDKKLILQERLTDDRRQFIYRIDKALFETLQEKTSDT